MVLEESRGDVLSPGLNESSRALPLTADVNTHATYLEEASELSEL